MSTICSFNLKPKIRTIPKAKPRNYSLGEYLRHERLKRNISQTELAKQFGITGVTLSNWELSRKPVHPKHFTAIINFIGYVPERSSMFDKLGTRTQLWRLQNNVSLPEFAKQVNVPIEEIIRIETARHGKIEYEIYNAINERITSSCEEHS